ncbi:hypothetical protein [Streptomyces sp. NPDC016845]|uniref:hypothetical protein n=1 Tax=Streptomyces sp. NPDC016845 TaxID=3364972 RepID=UPI00379BCBE2
MSILPSGRRLAPRPTVLTLALAAGFCLAAPGVAAAAEPPPASGAHMPTAEAPFSPGGPAFGQETVDFSGGRIVYTTTASGFDDAGTAYFEKSVVTVGGPGGPTWSTIRTHS